MRFLILLPLLASEAVLGDEAKVGHFGSELVGFKAIELDEINAQDIDMKEIELAEVELKQIELREIQMDRIKIAPVGAHKVQIQPLQPMQLPSEESP